MILIFHSSALYSTTKDGPEIELLNEIKKICKHDDKILDLGSNWGRFQMIYLSQDLKIYMQLIYHSRQKKNERSISKFI